MKKRALTLTIICKATSNYGESLGQISSVQKFYKNGKMYTMRSKESLKYAIMSQSGLYEDLDIELDKVAQKAVSKTVNASNCKALEGGYMNTGKTTYVRNSSFYLTDAVSCDEFVIDSRFHNNLNMARTFADKNGLNVQNDAGKVGLMPFSYEYDNSLKKYSVTIDLEAVGVDKNFDTEASNEEKVERVVAILKSIQNLSLVVKGNMDNAEPIFVVGGLSEFKTHYFDNCVNVKKGNFVLSEDLKYRVNEGFNSALVKAEIFTNEAEMVKELNPTSVSEFFGKLCDDVKAYYGV